MRKGMSAAKEEQAFPSRSSFDIYNTTPFYRRGSRGTGLRSIRFFKCKLRCELHPVCMCVRACTYVPACTHMCTCMCTYVFSPILPSRFPCANQCLKITTVAFASLAHIISFIPWAV